MKASRMIQALMLSGIICFVLPAQAGTKVKVRLKARSQSLSVSGFGIQLPVDLVRTRLPQLEKRRIKIERISQQEQSFWQITDQSTQDKYLWPDEVLKLEGEMMRQGIEPLPKQLFLHPTQDNRFDVVAELDIENYLAGVVPSEMPAGWPIETLKAQVVASRSYMLSLMQERRHLHFHLESSVFDQVYKHSNRVGVPLSVQKKVLKAIRDTEEKVLLTEDGNIYRSFYHADCGGQTEEAEFVWGTKKKNGTVVDESCPASPQARWALNLKRDDLRAQLARYFEWEDPNIFRGLLIAQRTPSGRVSQVEIVLADRDNQKLEAQDFRRLLGFDRLKSTNFEMTWFGDSLQIEGLGHGHGVGMCQWGARSMAKAGSSYLDILKRYYPYASIGKVPEAKIPEKLVSR